MSNRFSERAQRCILIAQEEAKRLNHEYVGPEHLLLGLIALGEGTAVLMLERAGVDLRQLRSEVERLSGRGDAVMIIGEIVFTQRSKKVLEYSVEEAQQHDHRIVGTEHILIGLAREELSIAARALMFVGVGLHSLRSHLETLGPIRAELAPAAVGSDAGARALRGVVRGWSGLSGVPCVVRIRGSSGTKSTRAKITLDVSVEVDARSLGVSDEPVPSPDLDEVERNLLALSRTQEFATLESFLYAMCDRLLLGDRRIVGVMIRAVQKTSKSKSAGEKYFQVWREPGSGARA